MEIFFYNTFGRQKERFESLEPGWVRMYTCGPTVYGEAHIGNLRAYLFEDLLRRTLKFFGYKVTQVMNLTDVDDKTIRGSQEKGVPLREFTQPFIERFFGDIDLLGIERAEFYPRATEHIAEMVNIIEKLLQRGYAYRADGSIYFRVESFPQYGQLSGMDLKGLVRGVRIDADEYEEKGDFRDFALWKAWTPQDGEVFWETSLGKGRPGWHIECSAMSMKYLGEEFDIHTGGIDNIFPHHENEIAQSVAATGKKFARYWLHCAHLIVDGQKMSKSLGNVLTLSDLLSKGYSPRVIRYTLLSTHYRQTLNFTAEAVEAAQAALGRLDTLHQLIEEAKEVGGVRAELMEALAQSRNKFAEALADDLNISGALAALFDLVSEVHRYAKIKSLSLSEAEMLKEWWKDADRVLGVLSLPGENLPEEIRELVIKRAELRGKRLYKEADQIRDQLLRMGYALEDGVGGTRVIWKEGREWVKNRQ